MTTERLKILCLVRAGHRTIRGIADAMGLDYHSGVHKQVETLRQAGLVEHTVDAAATLRLTKAGRQAVEGYFLIYKAGGGVILERMVKSYVSNVNPSLAGRTRTGP